MKRYVLALLAACFVWNAQVMAVEVAGVAVPDTVNVSGHDLVLNGAGVRSKFFFDIYVAALYLPSKLSDAKAVLDHAGQKRIWMHFLYDEVSRDKLVDGWLSGFEKNNSAADFEKLKARLEAFNMMFSDMRKGDEITFDFSTDGKVQVLINGEEKGLVTGADFQHALLQVWLGEKPADKGLKKGLLGL